MKKQLKNDLADLDTLLETVKAHGLEFLKNIGERPTSTYITYSEHPELNETGFGGNNTLQLFNRRFEQFVVASTGSKYFGFVTGGSTLASIMGTG